MFVFKASSKLEMRMLYLLRRGKDKELGEEFLISEKVIQIY